MKIKKGDNVISVKGKDRGKSGKVLLISGDKRRVVVEGLNMFKKHNRPKKQGEKGQIVSVARSMAIANLMLVCTSCKKPARFGSKMEGKKKVLFCKKCKAVK